jgi:hypothetical protein
MKSAIKHYKRKLYVVTFRRDGEEFDWDILTSNANTIQEVEQEFVEYMKKDYGCEIEDVEVYPQTEVDGYRVLLETPKKS